MEAGPGRRPLHVPGAGREAEGPGPGPRRSHPAALPEHPDQGVGMPQVTVSLGKWLDGQRRTRARPSILARIYPLDLPAETPDRPRTMMLVAGPTPAGGERV